MGVGVAVAVRRLLAEGLAVAPVWVRLFPMLRLIVLLILLVFSALHLMGGSPRFGHREDGRIVGTGPQPVSVDEVDQRGP